MNLNLLLVDDDVEYAQLLSRVLQRHGITVSICKDGRQAIDEVARHRFDLILLDVTMPVMDGFATLHRLQREAETPVIMLTSRIASVDRVQGLDGGADDYICKPCDPDELLSRIRAVLRRAGPSKVLPSAYHFGSHRFIANSRELTCDDRQVHLTSLEADLLSMLLLARGKSVSREAIALVLQDRALDAFDRSLDVHISRLRTKLGKDARDRIRHHDSESRGSIVKITRSVLIGTTLAYLVSLLCGFLVANIISQKSYTYYVTPTFEAMDQLELEEAISTLQHQGPASLGLYLSHLDSAFGGRHFLLSSAGSDLANGGSQLQLLPKPPASRYRAYIHGVFHLARRSQDGQFWFAVVGTANDQGPATWAYFLVLTLVTTGLLLFSLFYLVFPLRRIRNAMVEFGSGEMSRRLPSSRQD
jgi:two-component system response regulator CpxR